MAQQHCGEHDSMIREIAETSVELSASKNVLSKTETALQQLEARLRKLEMRIAYGMGGLALLMVLLKLVPNIIEVTR